MKHGLRSIVISLLLGCSLSSAGPVYTALVAAYDGELDNIFELLQDEKIDTVDEYNGVQFFVGSVHNTPIVVFKTGIGLTNAAMVTQLAFSHYAIKQLLFSGVAGGLDPSLQKGDVLIPAKWHFYDYGARFSADGKGGYRIPEFMHNYIGSAQFGNFFPYAMTTRSTANTAGTNHTFYMADTPLLAVATKIAAQQTFINAAGSKAKINVGTVGGSGLAFNDDAAFAGFIRKTWGTSSVDMESAAIAQVCWANSVPFLQIRAISDNVGNDAPNEFYEFKDVAEKNAARFLNLMLIALAPDI